MQFNGSVVNGVGLNGPARITFLLAFCALAGGATVSAEPSITRYCASAVGSSAELQVHPLQFFSARSTVSCTANILATEPYQTFATVAFAISSGESAANGLVTRHGTSYVVCDANGSSNAWLKQAGVVSVLGHSELTISSVVTRPAFANIAGTAVTSGNPYVIRRGIGAFTGTGGVIANGSFVQSGKASGKGTALMTGNAGYSKPSASLMLSGAQVFAYARAFRQAKATVSGSAQVTSKAKYTGYGVSNITGTAVMGAWVVQMQGASHHTWGSADVLAEATYVHQTHTSVNGGTNITTTPFVSREGVVAAFGKGTLRAESTVNNQLDGYALPDALSQITINVQGVVVAPVISHFDGSSVIEAIATYVHHAKAAGSANAKVTTAGTYFHQGIVNVNSSAEVLPTAHWEWYGGASVDCYGFDVAAFPKQFHTTYGTFISGAEIEPDAYRIQNASTTLKGDVVIAAESGLIRYVSANVFSKVDIAAGPSMVGSPTTRDPLERKMYRKFQNRVMHRPYTDRVMKAKRK